jgi:Heterokaryon incompatibility protein (HET)
MALYAYTPLKADESMRVLIILPDKESSEVTCILKPRLKQEEYEYDALSYAWGVEKPTESIQILTQSRSFVIPVIPNLKAALRQLRHPTRSVVLWVDAICINQKDKVEKSHQVPRMAEIYSEAVNVRVWLGKEEENKSERALKFIHRILDFENFDRLIADDRLVEDWAALLSLMKRPWFGRRWVVQEIALARRAFLHCGKDYVSWEDFADAMRLFEERQEAIEEHFLKSPFSGFRSDLVADIKAMSATRLGRFHKAFSYHES